MIFKQGLMKIKKFYSKTDSEKTPIIMKLHVKESLQSPNNCGKGKKKFNLCFKKEQSKIKTNQYKVNPLPKEKKLLKNK